MSVRRTAVAGLAALMMALAGPALAQRSLFDTPADDPPAAPAPAQPRPKPKPKKPSGPVPARAISVQNASQNTLTSLEVSSEGKSAKLAKPLAPKGKTTLRLPAVKGCMVSVAASFDGSGEAQASDFDICKDKLLRFTE